MSAREQRIERRARLLAEALLARVDELRDFLVPPGERPPFHTVLQRPQALVWWRTHRYDELGAQVLAGLRPEEIMQLDAALAAEIERERALGMGVNGNAII